MKTQEQVDVVDRGASIQHDSITGLILSGGGARAAYQVGVLSAIADLLPDASDNPFEVIVGTSAGAINAVSLACGALDFQQSIRKLSAVWRSFRTELVYRTDWIGVLRQASRFMVQNVLGFGRGAVPVALLDNSPLRQLLLKELDFSGINLAVARRKLRAVAVTAFAYQSGQAVTFYQGRSKIEPWTRHRRNGLPARLRIEHLMASSAIPLVFPPERLNNEYFGDGAVRQAAPISPALHLGANRILVIGVSTHEQEEQGVTMTARPPSLAQIGGHLLNSTFTDNLESDLELLKRLNELGAMLPERERQKDVGLSPVEVLVISPSKKIDDIAARHRHQLPASLRLFLRGPGAMRASGGGVLSYLLFERSYCNELIELGYQDAMSKKAELLSFFGLIPA